jgi:SNF2 family DNA or RNA helicase
MLKTTPRSYQEHGISMLENNVASYIAHEMGCGKTLVPIAYIDKHRPKKTLIICPKAVVPVWVKEFDKHLGPHEERKILVVPLDNKPGKKTRMTGTEKVQYAREQRDLAEKCGWPIVFIINYESARMNPVASAFCKPVWDLVVADEIHRIKSPSGNTSRWMSKLGKKCLKRVGLSGTPMPHSPLDVFGQFRFLAPDLFGWNFTSFKSTYAEMGGYRHPVTRKPLEITGFRNIDELKKKFYSIGHRVTKEEAIDLPEFRHVERYCGMPSKAWKAYDGMEKELIAEMPGDEVTPAVAANVLVKGIRLQQITSGFVKNDDGAMIDLHHDKDRELTEFIKEDVPDHEPVVVFCKFKEDLKRVWAVAEKLGRPYDEMSGARKDVQGVWEPKPGAILAAQIQAGGTGIDLTASHFNVFYSQTYNMGDYDQALSRSHRHGQTSDCVFMHLLVKGTVDDSIRKALDHRAQVVGNALSQADLNKMIVDQIKKGRALN